MDLVHCIYCSASAKPEITPKEIDALLEECRHKNGAAEITGMLLYRNGSFFQILEGDRTVVEALFEKISMDKRHKRTTKIILEQIPERAFGQWTMGHSNIKSSELEKIPGLNDFFIRGTSFLELGEGRAKKLLSAYKEGAWRLSLS